jgi:hypothetical protein
MKEIKRRRPDPQSRGVAGSRLELRENCGYFTVFSCIAAVGAVPQGKAMPRRSCVGGLTFRAIDNVQKHARITGFFLTLCLIGSLPVLSGPDVNAIISQSVEATRHDWDLEPQYQCFERDRVRHGNETYKDIMIDGSPYQILVKINDQPLSPDKQAAEQRKLQETISKRNAESPAEKQQRIEKYKKQLKTEHNLIAEMIKAFDFRFTGEQNLNGFRVYVLVAEPRPGYQPTSAETEVLKGMKGRLWIDKKTHQWVKVQGEVMHPVTIYGFVAQVEPGTEFELEQMPVGNDVWLPKHFGMQARVNVLYLFGHHKADDQTYFDYSLQQQQKSQG